ncbi:hypothetical protein BPAE_0406g00060 [Botrytis paeoniae]|uniref:ABC transporter domain-containing protein n=1 Tax=Botrytis paeoniae TaxID=278948 RepID=A0A4Z1F9B1_9HELO|nr:hypothetical protein BPAE_0406g00060 [Botrytis paeoniae]
MLMVVYLIAYFINDSKEPLNAYDIALDIQGILGLNSPAANLLRAFFIATDNFGITCGETGCSAWFFKFLPKKKMPATPERLDFGIEGRESPNFALTVEHDDDIPLKPLKGQSSVPVLVLSKITKFFKSLLAVQEISLAISTNKTLALLGANGAGKQQPST